MLDEMLSSCAVIGQRVPNGHGNFIAGYKEAQGIKNNYILESYKCSNKSIKNHNPVSNYFSICALRF